MKTGGPVLFLATMLIGSLIFASRLWSWVLNFDPGFVFAHDPAPTGSPMTSGVTILLVDGLRLDASRKMEALNALRARGASIEAQVGTPSFSRPGRATIVVGAYPLIHGVTTNRQKRAMSLDNLIRRVGAMGGTCRVGGSKIWGGLFATDIARCGVYREIEGKEGPGAFVRQIGEVRSSQEGGVAFVLEQAATLRIADVVSTDFAAHEYGGASPEYAAEVARIDALIGQIAKEIDLEKETFVVTADHGHRDEGGHGGEEALVLTIPTVMVGAGIRAGMTAAASQADIAPTLAVLLGAGLPVASSGSPIESILLGDDTKRVMMKGAAVLQKQGFETAIAARLDLSVAASSKRPLDEQIHTFRQRESRAKLPIALLVSALTVVFLGAVVYFADPDRRGLSAGTATAILGVAFVFLGPAALRLPLLSFSAINYDEMLIPFFRRIMTLSALVTLTSVVVSMLVARHNSRRVAPIAPGVQASSLGLILCGGLTVLVTCLWWWDDLLSPVTLPGSDRLVVAYAWTLSLTSASLTTLFAVGTSALIERSRKRTR